MLLVRLKQLETALADGRLDEAFELARAADLRVHRRGQELVGRLWRAMLQRGQAHLAHGELESANQDCEKVIQLGGNLPEAMQLRTAINHATSQQRKQNQHAGEMVAMVRRQLQQGQLSMAEQLIGTAPVSAGRAQLLKAEVAVRRGAIQSATKRADAALAAGDWEAAIDHLSRLDRVSFSDPAVRELASSINKLVVERTTQAIESGRLDAASLLLKRHEKLAGQWDDAQRLRQTLRDCRELLDRIAAGDAAMAEQIARQLSQLWPSAGWLAAATAQLQRFRESAEQLRAGPLHLLADRGIMTPVKPSISSIPTPQPLVGADLLLHVDDAGSFRVIGKPVVTIGPHRASGPVDIELMADASLPVITITRSEEDYFLESPKAVLVNEKPATRKLLSNGDSIALGTRCRLRFRRPSAASASAVIDLSGARLERGDVRQIILLDRELVLGPGNCAHIRADNLSGPAVIQHRGELLVSAAADPVRVDGRKVDPPAEIAPKASLTIGPIGITVVREEQS